MSSVFVSKQLNKPMILTNDVFANAIEPFNLFYLEGVERAWNKNRLWIDVIVDVQFRESLAKVGDLREVAWGSIIASLVLCLVFVFCKTRFQYSLLL